MIISRMAATSVNQRQGTASSESSREEDEENYTTENEDSAPRLVPDDERRFSLNRSATQRFMGKTINYQEKKKLHFDSELWTDSEF